ncbi:hypothetical protein SedNR2807_06470 [Citrobacter sedlakii]
MRYGGAGGLAGTDSFIPKVFKINKLEFVQIIRFNRKLRSKSNLTTKDKSVSAEITSDKKLTTR